MIIQSGCHPVEPRRSSRGAVLARVSTLALVSCGLTLAARPAFAQTLPVIGAAPGSNGGATISTAAKAMTVNVNDASRVVTWTSYNVGNSGETVAYTSPNSITPFAVLNRVLPGAPSLIEGGISSQGNIAVWIVNPNGITFSPTGSFNGGSLVLSTLDVASDAAFLAGSAPGLAGASTAPINLQGGGIGTIVSSGAIVVVGQDITAAKAITATREVALIAARDVSFPIGLASPLAITVNAGTTLGTAQVSANGVISGASVRMVGASQGGAIANLLGVGASGSLTATSVGGVVLLATKSDTANNVTVSSAAAVDGVNIGGTISASAATGKAALSASGGLTASGAIGAGSVSLNAQSLAVTSTTTSQDLSLTTTGSDLTFPATGTYNWTRNLSLTTSSANNVILGTIATTTPGDATIVSGGNVIGNSLTLFDGNIGITAAGAVQGSGTGRLALAANGANNAIVVAAGTQAKLGAVSTSPSGLIDLAGQTLDLTSTVSRDLTLKATGSNLILPATSTYTRNLSLTTTGANDVIFGTINATTTGNATIVSGREVIGDSLTLANGNIAIAAATNVRGTGSARLSLAANGANNLITVGAGATGISTLGNIVAGSGATVLVADQIALTAGTLDLTSANARNGRVALTSTTAVTGHVTIGGSVTANGDATVSSAADVRIAPYNPLTPTSGFIRSTTGNVNVNATGVLFAIGDSAGMIPDRGFGSVNSGGNITAAGAGDLRINSLVATGLIGVNIGGSLTGRATTPDVIGGALFANGAGGTVGVTASTIKLNTIQANGTVTTSAPGGIALGDATSSTQGVGLTSAAGSYVRALTQANSIALGTSTALNLNPNGLTTSGVLEAGFGTTSLSAGTGQNVTVVAGANGQLGTVIAGNTVDLIGRALTVTNATASAGALNLTASTGTLELGTGSAQTTALIRKLGGTLVGVPLGDELRVTTSLTTTTGDATANSNTSARLAQVTATGGSVSVTTALGDVTGLAGPTVGASDTNFGRVRLTTTAVTGDVTVTAARLAQLGTVVAGRNVTVTGGNVSPSNGAVDVTSATANGALALTARAIAPVVGSVFDGHVILGTGVAGTTAALSNTATGGTAGNVIVGDQVRSGGTATLTSANDVLIKPTDALATTGFISSTGGNVLITAAGSVFGLGDTAMLPTQTGYGAVSVTGIAADVTISGAGDARIDSIIAGRAIIGGVSGSLTGQIAGSIGTTVIGGTLQANGVGGNVTVNANNGAGGVVKLAVASADQTVSISANGIAIGRATSTNDAVKIMPAVGNNFYVGALSQAVSIALTFGGTLGPDPSSVSLTNVFETGFGRTLLNAGTSINLTVGRNAQLGTIAAATSAAIIARGLSAISASTSAGALSLTALSGTLDLGTGTAVGGSGTLTKQLGSATTLGDELRVTSLTASGTGTANSSTHVRLGLVRSTGADAVVIAGTGDITGIAAVSPGNSDTAFGRGDVTSDTSTVGVTAARLVQLGNVSSAQLQSLGAGNPTTNGAIDVTNAVSTAGTIFMSARAATPITGVYDGRILLGSANALLNVSLTNVDRGGNSGDIIVANTITAGQDVLADAVRDATLQAVTSAPAGEFGSLVIRAGRDVQTANIAMNEDIAVRAGRNATFGALTAGDDIDVRAKGDVTLTRAFTSGFGSDGFAASFASPTVLSFAGETTAGANISLVSTQASVDVAETLSAPNNIFVNAMGTSASIGGNITSTALGVIDVRAITSATLSGASNSTQRGNVTVIAGSQATVFGNVSAGNPVLPPPLSFTYGVQAGTGILLGDATARTQSATGAVTITTATGDVTQGAGLLTLQSNSDQSAPGTGTDVLGVGATTGSVLLGNTDFVGGSVGGRESTIQLTATNASSDIMTGKVDGDRVLVSAGRDVTFNRNVTAGSLARGADGAVLASGNQTLGVAAGRNFVAQSLTTLGAAHDIDVRAGGAATAVSLDATGMVVTRAGGNIGYATVKAGEDIAIRSNTGSVTLGDGSTPFDVQAGDDIDVTAGGTVSLTSATTTGTGADTRSVLFTGAGLVASYGAQTTTGANIGLNAGTTATVTRAVTSAGTYGVQAGTGILLGDATARTQSATGAVTITTATGDVTQGAGLLTLQSNSDQSAPGTGTDVLGVGATTGSVLLGNTDFVGGSVGGRESEVRLASGASTQVRNANGDRFAVLAGTAFKANGNINAGSLLRVAESAVIADPQTVDIRATSVDFNAINAFGAGHDIDILGTGALNGTTLVAARNSTAVATTIGIGTGTATTGNLLLRATAGDVVVDVGGAAGTATVDASQNARVTTSLIAGQRATLSAGALAKAPLVRSTLADVVVSGATIDVGTADAKTSLMMTASNGNLLLDKGIVGTTASLASTMLLPATIRGDIVVTTSLLSGGAATVNSVGNVQIAKLRADTGDATVTAFGNVTGVGAGTADLEATLGKLGVTATGGLARLGTLRSAAAMTVRAKVSLDIATATSGGDVSFDTDGKATLGGAINAAGRTVTVTASDADIGGTLTANRAVLVNRATSTNTLRLGNGAGGTGGFELTQDEINRIIATEVVLDAGTSTGSVPQNVIIGSLALGNTTGSSRFEVLGTRRIDVTGTIGDGSTTANNETVIVSNGSPTRAFRLGGDASLTGKAVTIRVAANPGGTGGKILMGGANVDLRAARIGVGQDQGFLQAIGMTSGGTPLTSSAVATQYIGNPNSTLYNADIGGAPYAPPGQSIFTARTLTVHITDYALFQNTSGAGVTRGAVLGGSVSSPIAGALVASGPNPPDAGGFALFGSINGISDSTTALLGPTAIGITAIDRANIRVNGCIVGSGGGGCLVNVVSQPALNVFDSSRTDVFKTSANFQIPFDPVVGTNNESLFGDVGTLGLADIPLAPPTICTDLKDCPITQEPKK